MLKLLGLSRARLMGGVLVVGMLAIGGGFVTPAANAADIIEDWGTAKTPPAPQVKPVTLNAKETALLVLDFGTACDAQKRPRCTDSLPKVAQLLKDTRAAGAMVIYCIVGANKIEDVPSVIAAKPGEPVIKSVGVDKFFATDMEKTLKDKGIKTVVVVGTSAHGAVLYTASEAALREYNVIVPVDGMSAEDAFGELATAWILANGPASVSRHTTLTRTNLVHF